MKTTQTKTLVAHLLHLAAIMMMSESPMKSQVKKQAEKIEGRLRAELTADELTPIETMAKTMVLLAQKLAAATDINMLALAHSYAQALLDGEVLIAKDVPITDDIRAHYDLNT